MNKKVYLQPQIKCAPLPMESLLASWSKPKTESNIGTEVVGPNGNGSGKSDELNDSKENFNNLNDWDSWE